jgi:hypothetical protein
MLKKTCTKCDKVHRDFSQLTPIGTQQTPAGFEYELALYNCVCGTTLAIKVAKLDPETTEEDAL